MPTTPSRRRFLASGAAAAAPAFLSGQAADRPPNIVSIVCDQMRGDAMGFLGHPNVRTPNLDRMAREGVVFDRCFVNNPVCLPSRKSCFSGLYPHQHGSLTNRQKPLLDWKGTMLEHFEQAGYRTGWVGKNHTYDRRQATPNIDFSSIRDREPFRAYNGMVPPHWHTDVYWPEEDCYPQVNSDRAVEFLDESRGGDPFFLHVSYFDPHPPYMAPAEYSSRYAGERMRVPDYVPASDLSPRLEEFKHGFGMDRVKREDLTEAMRYYYAQIEWGVDKQVGRLLAALRNKGLADNTIVVFTSDHGDFMGSHGLVRKGMFLYDALLHVPLIFWSPSRLPQGARTAAMAQHIDFFPTLADFAGRPAPSDLPGRSLRSLVEQPAADDPTRTIFTSAGYDELGAEQLNLPLTPDDKGAVPRHTQVMQQNMNPRYRTSMARTAEWKLVMTETRGPELFSMQGGVVERKNVAGRAEHAGVRRKLEKQLDSFWQW